MPPPPQHIVAASGLVLNPAGEVLLIWSPRRGWEFPGGQIEVGETLPEGLQREIYEETGIQAAINQLVGIYSNIKPPTKVIFGFQCTYLTGQPRPSRESLEVAWFPRDQVLDKITHPAIYDRMKDLLDFTGKVVYRVYTTDPLPGTFGAIFLADRKQRLFMGALSP